MKARILALLAMVLGVVSCQTEPEGLDVQMGGAVDATITVNIPDSETRAGGSNSAGSIFDNVNLSGDATIRYILKIYQKVGNEYVASNDRQVKYSDGTEVAFPVRLVPDRHYNFVVWADLVEGNNYQDNEWYNEDGLHYDTSDLKNITLKNLFCEGTGLSYKSWADVYLISFSCVHKYFFLSSFSVWNLSALMHANT